MVAEKYQNELKRIKKNVEEARDYFRDNYNTFHEFRKMVFQTSLTPRDIELNDELQRPQIEFNILEAYLSRLRGEFSKQEPSLSIRAKDSNRVDSVVIQIVESHIKSLFFDASNDMLEYNCYSDTLSGGFSAVKVYTDYENEMSFDHKICFERVFDPTL